MNGISKQPSPTFHRLSPPQARLSIYLLWPILPLGSQSSISMANQHHCTLHPPGPGSMGTFLNLLELYPILEAILRGLKQSELLCLMLTCKDIRSILSPAASTDCINNLRKRAIQHDVRIVCPSCETQMTRCVRCTHLFHVSNVLWLLVALVASVNYPKFFLGIPSLRAEMGLISEAIG